MVRGASKAVINIAGKMRLEMTEAERKLWGAIRNKQLNGLRFRRQYLIGQYVLDFNCPACKLVVELDGGVHDTRKDMDAARTQHLEAYGYHVIRFRNEEVLNDLSRVLLQILQAAERLMQDKKGLL